MRGLPCRGQSRWSFLKGGTDCGCREPGSWHGHWRIHQGVYMSVRTADCSVRRKNCWAPHFARMRPERYFDSEAVHGIFL